MARPARIYLPLDAFWLDDDKVIAAGERAAFLYVAILCRIKALDTDGVISRAQVARIGLPGWPRRLAKLVEVGLLVSEDESTFVVKPWSKWNELSHERAERHRRDRERKTRGNALTSADGSYSARIPDGFQTDSAQGSVLKQASKQARHGNPPQPPPVKDVLRRIHDTPHTAG